MQSKAITVTAKGDGGTEVNVDVPAIQALLGVKVGVTTAGGSSAEVTYTGPEYLTFGVKLFGIGISNGVWQVHGVTPESGRIPGNRG